MKRRKPWDHNVWYKRQDGTSRQAWEDGYRWDVGWDHTPRYYELLFPNPLDQLSWDSRYRRLWRIIGPREYRRAYFKGFYARW